MDSKNEKWVSVAFYYDRIEKLLVEAVAPLTEEIKSKGLVSDVIFNRNWDRGLHLLVLLKTTQDVFDSELKPLFKERIESYYKNNPAPAKKIELPVTDWFLPFSYNHIQFNDHFLVDVMETGGLQAADVADQLLASSSSIIIEFMKAAEGEWSPEGGIGLALQLHLGLGHAFGFDADQMALFYEKSFENMMEITQGGTGEEDFQSKLIDGLNETFQEQKEGLVGFGGYILSSLTEGESFDDEWFNQWVEECVAGNAAIEYLQKTGQYVTPEKFEVNAAIAVPVSQQEKWPVIEYYLRAINSQLGITDIYELNLIYTLKETTKEIALTV